MANTVYMSKIGLTGGEATKLDSIDGAGLVDGDAAFVNVSNVQYIYRLDADSAAAESSPNIIAPDTNPGDKRWILQSTLSPAPDIGAATGTSLTLSGLTASLPVFSDGSKKLVSNTMTGTGSVVMSASPTITGHPTVEGVTSTGATGTGKLVFDTSPTLVTPTIGAAAGTSLTLSGLTASLPVFSDGSKNLVSKSVADTLTALGVGSAAFYATTGDNHINVTGDGTNYSIAGTWTEVIDTGSCFSSGVFTAPATGWYVFSAYIYISGITSSHTSGGIYLVLNGALVSEFYGNIYAVSTPSGALGTGLCQVAYLEATQTAYLMIDISGGTKDIDITGLRFCGYRLK